MAGAEALPLRKSVPRGRRELDCAGFRCLGRRLSQGLKPRFHILFNVRAEARTYLRSKGSKAKSSEVETQKRRLIGGNAEAKAQKQRLISKGLENSEANARRSVAKERGVGRGKMRGGAERT